MHSRTHYYSYSRLHIDFMSSSVLQQKHFAPLHSFNREMHIHQHHCGRPGEIRPDRPRGRPKSGRPPCRSGSGRRTPDGSSPEPALPVGTAPLHHRLLMSRHGDAVSVPTCHTPSATASTLRSVAAPGSSLGGFRGTLRNARPSILPDLPRVLHGCHLWRCHSCPDTG